MQDSDKPSHDATNKNEKQLVKPRILLVEDYAPNVMVASAFLERFGYECDIAVNGIAAMEKIKTGNYSIALMDIQMQGLNGIEATRQIREYEKQQEKPRLYIIGMTAHALAGDRERCLSEGMDDYISKPFNPEELEHKLAAAMASEATVA